MDYYKALELMCQPVRAADFPRTLEPMQRLLAALGNPERAFPMVVVAGSVGKGTTSARIAAALRSVPGLKVGLYTGPHLHSFRERFVLDGRMISPGIFMALAEEVQQVAHRLDSQTSTFERALALGLLWFRRAGVKVAVLEAGIGGRWDAVNAVSKAVTVITPLEHEHVMMLGGSLQTIAYHKAGLIERGEVVFSVPQSEEAADVLQHEAEQMGAALRFVEADAVAPAVCARLVEQRLIPALPSAYPEVVLPARLESVLVGGRAVTVDGGHTPLAAARLWSHLDALRGPDGRVRLVVGMLRDKSVEAYLRAFDRPEVQVVFTQAPGHRALSADELAAQSDLREAQSVIEPDLTVALTALAAAEEPARAAAGSLRVAAAAREIYGLLTPDMLQEALLTRGIFEGEGYLQRLPPV